MASKLLHFHDESNASEPTSRMDSLIQLGMFAASVVVWLFAVVGIVTVVQWVMR